MPSPIILIGPTASGKSALAEQLARREGYEILSADSMQVYRGMDIGTAKPTTHDREGIVYHGLDLVNPDKPFSTGLWLDHARQALQDCATRGRRMIIVGGTGLYIKALLHGLDAPTANPEARARYETLFAAQGIGALYEEANRLSPNALSSLNADDRINPRRVMRLLEKLHGAHIPKKPPEKPVLDVSATPVYCLHVDSPTLSERIAHRVEKMFTQGLLDEVRELHQRYPDASLNLPLFKAIGYAEALAVLTGDMTELQAKDAIIIRTRQYARRQRTFFRHQLKRTFNYHLPRECLNLRFTEA
jgi:tRNA dimethylallyltransferase